MKRIPGFPGYYVDKQGRVYSKRTGNIKRLSPCMRKGYLAVSMYTSQGRKTKSVHRLVLETFAGKPENGQEARHLNGNALDNRLVNLVWSTHRENILDKEQHSTKPTRDKHGMSKLSELEVSEIRRLFKNGKSQKYIAEIFQMSTSQINNIVRNKQWRDV